MPGADKTSRRGLLLVISSPSGAGKTTLSRRLLAEDAGLAMSVSATTRAPRVGEIDGSDYHFLSDQQFDALLADNAFLEHARVFEHRYGTPQAGVEAILADGRDVLFDIDWQGTQQLIEQVPGDLVTIFILPPSLTALHQRLITRGKDTPAVINGRMAKAVSEISHWAEYDYVLVNDDIETCLTQLRHILAAERLKKRRQLHLSAQVASLVMEQDLLA